MQSSFPPTSPVPYASPYSQECHDRIPDHRLISEVGPGGDIELRIEQAPIPALQTGDVLVRVEAAPVHSSDLGMLLMAGDIAHAGLAMTTHMDAYPGRVIRASETMAAARK